jgi:hypothetical protein
MKRLAPIAVTVALLVAACGGSGGDGVATLSGDDGATTTTADPASQQSTEEAILAFSACMRDNGVEDFEDPDISADGSIQFRFGPGSGGRSGEPPTQEERDTIRQAFQACSEYLQGLAFGPGSIDRSEIEDNLYEFAACMRDNGYDMPDPDLSALGPPSSGQDDGEFQGPFGDIDPDDPTFQTALAACQDIFGGGFVFGGPGGPGGGRGPGGGTGSTDQGDG